MIFAITVMIAALMLALGVVELCHRFLPKRFIEWCGRPFGGKVDL